MPYIGTTSKKKWKVDSGPHMSNTASGNPTWGAQSEDAHDALEIASPHRDKNVASRGSQVHHSDTHSFGFLDATVNDVLGIQDGTEHVESVVECLMLTPRRTFEVAKETALFGVAGSRCSPGSSHTI